METKVGADIYDIGANYNGTYAEVPAGIASISATIEFNCQ